MEYLCDRMGLHDYILTLPQGYETKLGEQGLKFSGGQRQRLALARCLMKKGIKILLLDEATSAVDSQNEKNVMQLIKQEQKERGLTVLMTTHRLHLNSYCDEVVVMGGPALQRGSHSQLLAQGGPYATLWQHYVQSDAH